MSRRGVLGTVVVVVVVLAGVVVADRVAASAAERQATAAVEQNLEGLVGEPDLDIGGFPFLTQLLRGSLSRVTGHVDGVDLGGVPATDVDLEAHGVTTGEPYTVDSGTLEATFPTASIEQVVAEETQLEIDIAVQGDQIEASGEVLGVALASTLTPRVDDGRLFVDISELSLGGLTITVDELPDRIAERLQEIEIPIEGLPEGMTVTDAVVVPDGVRFTATGTDVALSVEE